MPPPAPSLTCGGLYGMSSEASRTLCTCCLCFFGSIASCVSIGQLPSPPFHVCFLPCGPRLALFFDSNRVFRRSRYAWRLVPPLPPRHPSPLPSRRRGYVHAHAPRGGATLFHANPCAEEIQENRNPPRRNRRPCSKRGSRGDVAGPSPREKKLPSRLLGVWCGRGTERYISRTVVARWTWTHTHTCLSKAGTRSSRCWTR